MIIDSEVIELVVCIVDTESETETQPTYTTNPRLNARLKCHHIELKTVLIQCCKGLVNSVSIH